MILMMMMDLPDKDILDDGEEPIDDLDLANRAPTKTPAGKKTTDDGATFHPLLWLRHASLL